uniref:Uncharacterized protein n=1 Tax=Anguilla anguilla TaxID=7936 RepID=A0A0E9TA24_ANGAN
MKLHGTTHSLRTFFSSEGAHNKWSTILLLFQ